MRAVASGTRAWLLQRLTAVYMLVFLVLTLGRCAVDPPASHEAWRNWIGTGGMRVATVLFFVGLVLHAWVGLRDVAMDYVHPLALRVALLALVGAGLAAFAAWMILVLAGL
ncbi:MAG: succinate dehydrogenase, hydrophobic membrane anchor protein [Betaproteobacteria bacterium]|jgi:succinate dehydrogenase / fumarate reductase membrane anchor subunit|nr:MAG: succinate dehydrogenase, hydrophobic membrane anchor protein [Betaproteobacteria bacterium]